MTSGQAAGARGTVEHLADVVLRDRLDDASVRLADAIEDTVPEYVGIDRADLVSSCRSNLRRSLQRLAHRLPEDADLVDAPGQTGVRRAREGLPLDALLKSYRLGGRLLWEEMRACADALRVDQRILVDASTAVWDVIEAHSSAAAAAYRAEEALLQQRDRFRQEALLDALLDGAGADPAFTERAAAVLQVPAAVPYVVVTARVGNAEGTHAQETLARAGHAARWRVRNGIEVGIVPLRGRTAEDVLAALASCPGPAALSPEAPGLAQVDRAYQLAEIALRTLPPRAGAVTFAQRLPEVLLATQPAAVEVLRQDVLGPLLALPVAERTPLLATLLATLRASVVEGMSSTVAAGALYCHRNTVLHRLERATHLVGRSLDDPRDRLLMHLALLALDLQQPTRPARADAPGR